MNYFNNYKITIVTQFSLSSSITNNWIEETRNRIHNEIQNVEIVIGVAGPSKISTLIKYAKVCGVNASTNFLKKQGMDITKLIKHSPDKTLSELKNFDGIHFFPFGGINELNSWVLNYMKGN